MQNYKGGDQVPKRAEEDFGFTFDDSAELTEAKESLEKKHSDYEILEVRLKNLYEAILPLLNNLKKNPEKETIRWPNRIEKIDEFLNKLKDIYEGKTL